MSEQRVCKLCDIREKINGNITEYVERYINEIQEEDRTPEEKYIKRLETCLSCKRFLNAMCTACGCFVELRAAIRDKECPYHLWK